MPLRVEYVYLTPRDTAMSISVIGVFEDFLHYERFRKQEEVRLNTRIRADHFEPLTEEQVAELRNAWKQHK